MRQIKRDADRLRSYAIILSNSTFDKLVRAGDKNYVVSKWKKYDSTLDNHGNSPTFRQYFAHVYNTLKSAYRSEYVYKNIIANEILLGKYSVNSTTLLNEFRVGRSIADIVLLNGTSRVFEIKTELDSPTKISHQLADYRKVFKETYLVTHYSLKDRYLRIIGEDVGLIVLTKDFKLVTIRKAKESCHLDQHTMMKCLRKDEFTNIVKKYYHFVPATSAIRYYRTCQDLILKIPIDKLHDLVIGELKKRTIKQKSYFISRSLPPQLKYIGWCLDFDEEEYLRLHDVLREKINLN
ncbi:MAG TPA: sce7726 family protein [Candidatus Kryptonia bacterium]